MKGDWNNYYSFIKMMYKGVKLNSLLSSFNKNFYRGQLISKVEYDNIYNYVNNNNKELIYSRCFLSFSTNESVAHGFLKHSHSDNIISVLLVINSSVNNETYASNTDVKEFSFYEGEEEVLFFPYSCFIVESIEEVDYYKQINLSYMGVYKNKIREEYLKIKDINEFLNEMQNDKFFKDISSIKNKIGDEENMEEYFKNELKKLIIKKKEEIEKEEEEKKRLTEEERRRLEEEERRRRKKKKRGRRKKKKRRRRKKKKRRRRTKKKRGRRKKKKRRRRKKKKRGRRTKKKRRRKKWIN